jgi:hypothetical protein
MIRHHITRNLEDYLGRIEPATLKFTTSVLDGLDSQVAKYRTDVRKLYDDALEKFTDLLAYFDDQGME